MHVKVQIVIILECKQILQVLQFQRYQIFLRGLLFWLALYIHFFAQMCQQ